MDAINFFKSDALRLPLRRGENDQDFEKYLSDVFARYLAEFNNLNSDDALTKHVKAKRSEAEQLCEGVKKAVREYLHGFRVKPSTQSR